MVCARSAVQRVEWVQKRVENQVTFIPVVAAMQLLAAALNLMVRNSLLFLVIALIATIEFISGFAVSVVPGWHTQIAPPFMIFSVVLLIWLFLLSLGYYMLERKRRHIPQKAVIIHLILTLAFFFYSNGAYSFHNTPNGFFRLIVPMGLFAIGQLIFFNVFMIRISASSA